MNLPNNVSDAVRKRNPLLYKLFATEAAPVVDSNSKRIRQSEKPLMNKLEAAWLQHLQAIHPALQIHSQEWRVKIANGAWFKVDHCAFLDGRWTAWEVKGPKEGKNVARGMLALKCAARCFPEVEWILVWRLNGLWSQQIVLT